MVLTQMYSQPSAELWGRGTGAEVGERWRLDDFIYSSIAANGSPQRRRQADPLSEAADAVRAGHSVEAGSVTGLLLAAA
ncbi:hypothetical protein [Streptomyces ambofaciens]|uniref:Uncharacterized protein SAML0239 n=1 Tax=Streptomyces ambofaciens (strain ATCC 23877 / 3486 / DSM 40053 / JCM 4204 / NBRC 12836 / NRRL B-2516) TaxID=278992 RepID=Q1RRC0_STRA7|nr:hypothetical protein [Streptomyces ambofaciens]CAI78168.1 unknown hypothetical protein [Streptomyces ambofaciens ATCC 23877]CAJ89226.1 hypothetical protein SAML0239 [Streptomyces ambofaciens ATCC 23877]